MAFVKQQHGWTRYFIYNNIRHDGKKLICEEVPYSILAPSLTLPQAPEIPVYKFTLNDYSYGFKGEQGEDTAGSWGLAPKANTYPKLDVIFKGLSANGVLPPVSNDPRNKYSEPFSVAVRYRVFRDRYYLTTGAGQARPNQTTPAGRWIYAKRPAFRTYEFDIIIKPYNFFKRLLNTTLLTTSGRSIATYNQNIVASDANRNVKFKQINGSTFGFEQTFYVANSAQTIALSSTFIAPSTGLEATLYPFDSFTKNDITNLNFAKCDFGSQVGITDRNIAVSYPLSGTVYIYSINERRPLTQNFEITKTKVLSSFNKALFKNGGTSMAYTTKTSYNKYTFRARSYREYLAVSSTLSSNKYVQFWQNDIVTRVRFNNKPRVNFGNTNTLSSFAFQNRWSSQPSFIFYPQGSTGSFGYKLAFVTADQKYNRQTDFLIASEPFRGKGRVHVYPKHYSANTFSTPTFLSPSSGARNYGAGLCASGPYIAVSAPRSVVNGVTGTIVDIFRIESRTTRKTYDQVGGGYKMISNAPKEWCGTKTTDVINNVYGLNNTLSADFLLYRHVKTDSIFIPNSGNLGYDIDIVANTDTLSLRDRYDRNYFNDHLVITGDKITYVYSKHKGNVDFLCTLSGASMSRIWDNNIYQLNNNNNVIVGNFAAGT